MTKLRTLATIAALMLLAKGGQLMKTLSRRRDSCFYYDLPHHNVCHGNDSAVMRLPRLLQKLFMSVLSVLAVLAVLATTGCAPSLVNAARQGDLSKVRALLDKGEDVDIKNTQGNIFEATALMAASLHGHTEIVRLLIDKGADVDVNSRYGGSILVAMARVDTWHPAHTEIAQLLIDKGANVNAKNPEGIPPIWYAAYFGHTELARLLMDKGADIEESSGLGVSPWVIAVKRGYHETASQLLSKGVDIPAGKALLFLQDDTVLAYQLNEDKPSSVQLGDGKIIATGHTKIRVYYRQAPKLGVVTGGPYGATFVPIAGAKISTGKQNFVEFDAKDGHIYLLKWETITGLESVWYGSRNPAVEDFVGRKSMQER